MSNVYRPSNLKESAKRLLRSLSPFVFYSLYYAHAVRTGSNTYTLVERNLLFQDFLSNATGKRCLQIGVKESDGAKFGDNWTSVDLYDDRPFIDHHYDIRDMAFPDATFDAIACISILEHVRDPHAAIRELHRVLKPGGAIWVQLPYCYPPHGSPNDFWRASPDGLAAWLEDFDVIACGSFAFGGPLVISSFYYGTKGS